MTSQIDYAKLAAILTAGQPMSYKPYPDGSLVVIAHDGKKHTFIAHQVQKALPRECEASCKEALSLKERSRSKSGHRPSEKPDPKPKPASARTRKPRTTKI